MNVLTGLFRIGRAFGVGIVEAMDELLPMDEPMIDEYAQRDALLHRGVVVYPTADELQGIIDETLRRHPYINGGDDNAKTFQCVGCQVTSSTLGGYTSHVAEIAASAVMFKFVGAQSLPVAPVFTEALEDKLDDAIEDAMLDHSGDENKCTCGTRNNMDGDVLASHRLGAVVKAVHQALGWE